MQVRLIRFRRVSQDGAVQDGPRVGVLDENASSADGTRPGTVATLPGSPALADLLALPVTEFRDLLSGPGAERLPLDGVELLAPVDGRTEVWAAGVTYERSRDARIDESEESADVYDRVYTRRAPGAVLQVGVLAGPRPRPGRVGPGRLPGRRARTRAGRGAQLRRRGGRLTRSATT